MKIYPLIIILLLACSYGYAQSLSFENLLSLTSMTGAQAHDFLTVSKGFKSEGIQVINGRNLDEYKSMHATPDKTEAIWIGEFVKSISGSTSRPLTYTTTQESELNNLLAEAKKSTLTMIFQGSDLTKNIYRFDNSLFSVTISITFDKKLGSVEIQQKL